MLVEDPGCHSTKRRVEKVCLPLQHKLLVCSLDIPSLNSLLKTKYLPKNQKGTLPPSAKYFLETRLLGLGQPVWVLAEARLEAVFSPVSGRLYHPTGPTAQIWQGFPESGSVAGTACPSPLAGAGIWLA